MPLVKRIVCLANSRKRTGRCIAGLELRPDRSRAGWIRPVSNRENHEVSEYERQYPDGSDPQVLDIIDVPLLRPTPVGYQQENWLLDPGSYWHPRGRMAWTDLFRLADAQPSLWVNGHSTFHGRNDQIPLDDAMTLSSSLTLVRVDRLVLSVFAPGEAFGDTKRRVQARFLYQGVDYRLWVTDPRYEREYLSRTDGDYQLGEAYLTVSLGEPYNGNCYKLVAAIIEQSGGLGP